MKRKGVVKMKFEQTKIFMAMAENFTRLANEYMHMKGSEEKAKEILINNTKYRTKEEIIKVAKKANQKVKYKFYDISVLN